MKHSLFSLALIVSLFMFAQVALAVPASPHFAEIAQPDGSRFQARMVGDEFWNAMEDAQGLTLVRDAQNYWSYAELAPSGELRPTAIRAGIDAAPQGFTSNLRPAARKIDIARQQARPQSAMSSRSTTKAVPFTPSGNRPVIVIVIGFTDRAIDTVATTWSDRFFGLTNSVQSYFNEVSGGQFNVTPASESQGTANDGIVFVSIARTHPNTSNAADPGYDDTAMLAIQAADADVDFSSFDTNTDGYVSTQELGIFFVLAGFNGAAAGAPSPAVWPFATSFGGNGISADSVQVSAYFGDDDVRSGGITYQSEHDDNANPAQIGAPCHEYMHNLGLPDLYDTSNQSEGCGVFALMAGGPWNDNGGEPGSSPAHPCAWSRVELGWETPSVANSAGTYTLADAATAAINQKCIRVPIAQSTSEYFLIENRNGAGFDAGLPSSGGNRGILIWHIDESNGTNQSAVNNAPNFTVDLEEASGTQNLELNPSNPNSDQGAGDDFYRSSGTASFNASTTPSSNSNAAAASAVSINVTSAAGASMDFELLAPAMPVFTSVAPSETPVGVAFSYTAIALADPAATYSVNGLPTWLSFDSVDTISGTPSQAELGTTANFTITATNTNGSAMQSVSLDVTGPPNITGMDFIELLPNATAIIQGTNLSNIVSVDIGGTAQTITNVTSMAVTFTVNASTPLGVQTLTATSSQSLSDTISVEMFATQPSTTGGSITFNPSFGGAIGTVVTLGEATPDAGTFAGRQIVIGGVKQLLLSRDGDNLSFAIVGGTPTGPQDLEMVFRTNAPFFPNFPISAPAALSGFVASTSTTTPGGTFTVDGTGAASITDVTIGGVAATFTRIDADTIEVTSSASTPGGTGQTLRLTNAAGDLDLTIDVMIPPSGTAPAITSSAPTTATEGTLYTYTITADGSPAPTFSVSGEPAWLTLSGNVLSGTPGTTDVGMTGTITITATNSEGMDTEIFVITVSAISTGLSAPSITSTAATTALVGSLYSYTITANGNPTPTFSVSGEPAWLTLSGATLSGTPDVTDIGTTGTITITATNSEGTDTQDITIIVTDTASGPSITSTAVTTATVGNLYRYTITADGAPAPTISVSGEPSWLTLIGNQLAGTPTATDVGSSGQITITATNSAGDDMQSFTINVLPMGVTPPVISSLSATSILVGEELVISGSGLGSSSVRIGGVFQTIVSNTGLALTIRVSSASPAGAQTLYVANANGSASADLTVLGGIVPGSGGSGGGGGGDSGGLCSLDRSGSSWALILLALFAASACVLRRSDDRA